MIKKRIDSKSIKKSNNRSLKNFIIWSFILSGSAFLASSSFVMLVNSFSDTKKTDSLPAEISTQSASSNSKNNLNFTPNKKLDSAYSEIESIISAMHLAKSDGNLTSNDLSKLYPKYLASFNSYDWIKVRDYLITKKFKESDCLQIANQSVPYSSLKDKSGFQCVVQFSSEAKKESIEGSFNSKNNTALLAYKSNKSSSMLGNYVLAISALYGEKVKFLKTESSERVEECPSDSVKLNSIDSSDFQFKTSITKGKKSTLKLCYTSIDFDRSSLKSINSGLTDSLVNSLVLSTNLNTTSNGDLFSIESSLAEPSCSFSDKKPFNQPLEFSVSVLKPETKHKYLNTARCGEIRSQFSRTLNQSIDVFYTPKTEVLPKYDSIAIPVPIAIAPPPIK